MQGWRISMEDAHAAILDLQVEKDSHESKPVPTEERISFFGVYDGHGGDKVASFAGNNIHKIVAKQEAFTKGDFEQALKDGFLATDRAILNGKLSRQILYYIPCSFFTKTPNIETRFQDALHLLR